jgi:hypothetical protein
MNALWKESKNVFLSLEMKRKFLEKYIKRSKYRFLEKGQNIVFHEDILKFVIENEVLGDMWEKGQVANFLQCVDTMK